jgi:hypothetical protein
MGKRDIIDVRRAWGGAAWFACYLAALAFTAACVPQGPTIPDGGDVIVNQNVNVGQGGQTGGGQGGTGSGACNPVASLGASLLGTGGVRTADIRIGQTVTLDTTPKDAQNQIRPDACNAATPVLWRLNPTAGICSLNNETTYTPTLTGVGVGRCEAFSQIGSVTAAIPVVVNVRQ